MTFTCLQSSGTSPSHHDESKIINWSHNGIIQFSWQSWIPPTRTYRLTYAQFACVCPDLIVFHQRYVFLVPVFSTGIWDFWRPVLLVKTEVKTAVPFAYPISPGPLPIQQHVHISPSLPFATCIFKNFILLLFTSFLRFNYKWTLAFTDISLHARQCLSIPLRLPIPASTSCKLSFHVWLLSGAPCSSMNELSLETYYTKSFSKNKKCISGFTQYFSDTIRLISYNLWYILSRCLRRCWVGFVV